MNDWRLLAVLAAVVCGLRAAAPVAIGRRPLPARVAEAMPLLPPALFAALLVTGTFGLRRLELDARAAGVAAAAVAVALRAPFAVVLGVAAAVTAVLRAVG